MRFISPNRTHGSVLVIVLWVSFGLISLALYFGNAMSLELKAADNRAAGMEAEHAIEGAARYSLYVLNNATNKGSLPDILTYRYQAEPIGSATFWFLGRTNSLQSSINDPAFGLIDEGSKLNINNTNVTADMLLYLPGMTAELAGAIIDWRDADSDISESGAEDDVYLRRNPGYKCKNGLFETVDELRLLNGAYLDVLLGEDANQNGILDPNENDGDVSPPHDNKDGKLDPGVLDYITIYSKDSTTNSLGAARVAVNGRQPLIRALSAKLDAPTMRQVTNSLGPQGVNNLLELYIRSGLTADQFALVEDDLCNPSVDGLVNVSTASEKVLSCIPGIGIDKASTLVAYRLSNPGKLTSIAWVAEALGKSTELAQAGRFLTTRSYQFTADIAAIGHEGRGYHRTRFVIDTLDGTARIAYRQDLTHLGWALGRNARLNRQLLAKSTR